MRSGDHFDHLYRAASIKAKEAKEVGVGWNSHDKPTYRWAWYNNVQEQITKEVGYEFASRKALEAKEAGVSWRSHDRSTYGWAKRNDVLQKISKEVGLKLRPPPPNYKLASIKAREAKEAGVGWHSHDTSTYGWARRNGVDQKIAKEVGLKPRTNYKLALAKAREAKEAGVGWWSHDNSTYDWAVRNGVDQKISKEVGFKPKPPPPPPLNYKSATIKAREAKEAGVSWIRHDTPTYRWAKRKGAYQKIAKEVGLKLK